MPPTFKMDTSANHPSIHPSIIPHTRGHDWTYQSAKMCSLVQPRGTKTAHYSLCVFQNKISQFCPGIFAKSVTGVYLPGGLNFFCFLNLRKIASGSIFTNLFMYIAPHPGVVVSKNSLWAIPRQDKRFLILFYLQLLVSLNQVRMKTEYTHIGNFRVQNAGKSSYNTLIKHAQWDLKRLTITAVNFLLSHDMYPSAKTADTALWPTTVFKYWLFI